MADKTYILTMRDGCTKKVTVPEEWKVTFGPLFPGSRGESGGRVGIRFYEGKEKQRAVFVDVVEFRDESIPILEKVSRTQAKRMRKDTPDGAKDVIVEARMTEWRDPDGDYLPDNEFLALPELDES